jgi:peptide/nickel transport system substrate-binding protein
MSGRFVVWGTGLVLGAGVWLLGAVGAPPQPAAGKDAGPVLYVGVRSLPEFLSPATAWTDPERQAVELLFEGLVRAEADEGLGERFVPVLAQALPRAAPLSRQFRLAADARWSDGRPVTSADVRHTAQLLKSKDLPGRSSEWTRLLHEPRVGDDPLQVDFRLEQGYLEPLALLTFPVLPQRFADRELRRADDPDFARAPVGSGPYQYRGRRKADGRACAVFAANPRYARADRPGMPFIREIRFYAPAVPAADFRAPARPLHLLDDVLPEQAAALTKAGAGVRPLPGRRVHFLAVNHRVPALARLEVRQALAHAINRDEILKGEPFRNKDLPDMHVPLNGPFPAGSWACDPKLKPDPYNFDVAKSKARKAVPAGEKLELSLKYPDDDPRAEAACEAIREQVEKLETGLRLRPEKLAPHKLRSALDRRDYELAYHHHDYASEVYWLWPLFDPRPAALAAGGPNYLGFADPDLEKLFKRALGHRQFAEVQKWTQEIHAHLFDQMPLIPLWQLHRLVAVHPDLAPVGLEAPRLFTHAAAWQLKK